MLSRLLWKDKYQIISELHKLNYLFERQIYAK